jgi:hypothetical protein
MSDGPRERRKSRLDGAGERHDAQHAPALYPTCRIDCRGVATHEGCGERHEPAGRQRITSENEPQSSAGWMTTTGWDVKE